MTVPARPTPLFADIADVSRRLAETGYLPDTASLINGCSLRLAGSCRERNCGKILQ